MRANSFNKRNLATMAIAMLCCFSAKAQDKSQWSIVPSAKAGVAIEGLEIVYHFNASVDAKYHFNEHWGIISGLEYEYRMGKGKNFNTRIGLRHFFRVPALVEFTHKWFYVNAGLFAEIPTNPRFDEDETVDFGYGQILEIGGRIRLTDNDRLRLGVQSQTCFVHTTHQHPESTIPTAYGMGIGYSSLSLSVGYEHRF